MLFLLPAQWPGQAARVMSDHRWGVLTGSHPDGELVIWVSPSFHWWGNRDPQRNMAEVQRDSKASTDGLS